MKKICPGYYKFASGWTLERCATGGWNVYNNEGGLVDNLPTKKRAMEIYS